MQRLVLLLLLHSQEKLNVSHIIFTVSDVEVLLSRHVLLGLVNNLDVSDVRVEQRHSHLTSELVDLVSEQDVGSQVELASLDTNYLAGDTGPIEICDLDDITGAQALFRVNERSSLSSGVMFLEKLLVQERSGVLAVSPLWKRFENLCRGEGSERSKEACFGCWDSQS